MLDFALVDELPDYDSQLLVAKGLDAAGSHDALAAARDVLAGFSDLDDPARVEQALAQSGDYRGADAVWSELLARSPADAPWPSLGLQAHEYVHLFNVKRLRPVELGPFDFETAPTTGSLWMAEGVTSYYSGLLLTRAGLQTPETYLVSLSSLIGGLQTSPGRRLQSVEQSSLEVWTNSLSGVNAGPGTVSYYNKGQVLGLLLDARIRRATGGRRSLDDAMRLAYRRYSGERGFSPGQLRQTFETVAGVSLADWFRSAVSSTDELDYTELLDWFGLRFVSGTGPAGAWTLERRPDQTTAQRARFDAWITGR